MILITVYSIKQDKQKVKQKSVFFRKKTDDHGTLSLPDTYTVLYTRNSAQATRARLPHELAQRFEIRRIKSCVNVTAVVTDRTGTRTTAAASVPRTTAAAASRSAAATNAPSRNMTDAAVTSVPSRKSIAAARSSVPNRKTVAAAACAVAAGCSVCSADNRQGVGTPTPPT